MRMFVGGEWVDKAEKIPVLNPYDGSTLDTVPKANAEDVEMALATAVRGAKVMGAMPAHKRYTLLRKAADLLEAQAEDFARTITQEEGKPITEGRAEVMRAVETLTLSAEEAKRIYGETVPLDAAPGTTRQFGFTIKVPCGVVVAISPFNFPLNLVMHKVGPALAAGNAVIIKPATDTPLSALKLTGLLLEAGVPPEGVQCITGPGSAVGNALCSDPRVRKITFTGSRDVGEHITKVAGLKKVTMELGSNAPLIVMPDADLEKVVAATVASGYSNAGQTCISAQRVLTSNKVYGDFLEVLKPKVEAIVSGNPLQDGIAMGPMVREADAVRVGEWIQEAVAGGARIVTGGDRNGAMYATTIVADVDPDMRISRDELFGPAVAVTRFDSIDEAIALAMTPITASAPASSPRTSTGPCGFAREVHSGNLMINWGPQWRADMMPYGGLKESGMGKEGPRYAVQEMLDTKMVVFHL